MQGTTRQTVLLYENNARQAVCVMCQALFSINTACHFTEKPESVNFCVLKAFLSWETSLQCADTRDSICIHSLLLYFYTYTWYKQPYTHAL